MNNRIIRAIRNPKEAIKTLRSKYLYYKRIQELPITNSGITKDGIPFIKLTNGPVFYGYLPTTFQKYIYKIFYNKKTKNILKEECINVASDIEFRYYGVQNRKKHLDFKTGDVIIEIGAYIGYYSMRAADVINKSGHVVAIEAIPANFNLLKKNIKTNVYTNITAVSKAAWHSKDTIIFQRHHRQRASAKGNIVKTLEELPVSCNSLDNILKDLKITKVNFVRIQVNGAEMEVLKGMTKTLEQSPKLLIAAIYNKDGHPISEDITVFLKNIGYTTEIIEGSVFAYK